MQLVDGELLFSASDLINFLECEHLTRLDLEHRHGRLEAQPKRPDAAELISRKGEEHEVAYVAALRRQSNGLVEIDTDSTSALADTSEAMHAGAPTIHQAALRDGRWRGYADFLERIERASSLGDFGYEAADTKLARRVKPYFLIQLCLYSELIAATQGAPPRQMHVILGSGKRLSFRVADFAAYYRRIKRHFLEQVDAGLGHTYPDPVEHCALCRWTDLCDQRRIDDDHLSLVAGIHRSQIVRLSERGVTTVAELAQTASADRPPRVGAGSFERLRQQSRLQVAQRETGVPSVELLPVEEHRGFCRLPRPSEGDVFFDIEGDPFYEEGLEYLLGVAWNENGQECFEAFWGTNRARERSAFEALVDWLIERRRRYPDMHVYHYAPYEPTALKRLMGLHGSREDEVDQLLRGNVLVDLYRVVAEGLRISQPSYSLKKLEVFYMPEREASLTDGEDSILMFEEWLESEDQALLDGIEAYNRDDCISTLRLRDWLLKRRDQAEERQSIATPWRRIGETEVVPGSRSEADEEVEILQLGLWRGLPEDREELTDVERPLWLLGHLLDYHRREDKPVWWQLFERFEVSDEELVDVDTEAIGGLEASGPRVPIGGRSKSSTQRLRFPVQEHKLSPGSYLDPFTVKRDPETGNPDPFSPKSWEVLELVDDEGELAIKVGPSRRDAPPPRALVPGTPIPNWDQRACLRELARVVIDEGIAGSEHFRAARDVLARRPPRTAVVQHGGKLQEGPHELEHTKAVARGLEQSYLFIQGPPGSGKTYTGAHVILDLLAQGQRVGVAAPSHNAINNLLHEVEKHAREVGLDFRGLKKSGGDDSAFRSRLPEPLVDNTTSSADFPTEPGVDLMAGTAWLWCREAMRESVDYLVIDEAGQVSLADTLAMATAARNVILLGDPLQLAQVSQAIHPPGAGGSVLEHLLSKDATVPAEKGVFLDRTRRLHPDVCRFVSGAIYQDRLSSIPKCARQRIGSDAGLTGTGVRAILIDHEGNTRQSAEEVDRIAEEIGRLRGARYTDCDDATRELGYGDMMVVAPYNGQVRCLHERLPSEVQVGTVDKFQGQEAPVVFFSMATSSGEEIPRNVEFLYSRNRLNVAVSRAMCLAVLVCSPRLLTIRCKSPEQMRLLNALCLFVEMATAEAGLVDETETQVDRRNAPEVT